MLPFLVFFLWHLITLVYHNLPVSEWHNQGIFTLMNSLMKRVIQKIRDWLSSLVDLQHLAKALYDSISDFFRYYYGHHAAALSFFTLISMWPILILLTILVSYLPFQFTIISDTLNFLVPFVPFDILQTSTEFSENIFNKRGIFGWISLFFLYFFSSRLFLSLHHVLNEVFGEEEILSKRLWVHLLSYPIILVLLFILYFGHVLLDNFFQWALFHPVISGLFPRLFFVVFFDLSLLITFLSFFLIIGVIYHFLTPRVTRYLSNSVTSSLVISFLFISLKEGFGKFIYFITQVNPVYGIFGGIFGFIAWVFFSYVLVIYGARIVYYLDQYDNQKDIH